MSYVELRVAEARQESAFCLVLPGNKFHINSAGKHPLTITNVPSFSTGACVAGGLYLVLSPLDDRALL